MKKVFSLLITLAMLVSVAVVPMSVSADANVWDGETIDVEWAGEGTQASPYLITSAAELAGLSKTIFDAVSTTESTEVMPITKSLRRQEDMYFAYTGKYFKLTTDIDLGNKEWLPIGRMYMRFDGIFDGDGHVIKNVKVTKEYSAVGLFGSIGRNSAIKNLGVDGIDIKTPVTNGGAADYVANGDITRSVDRVRAYGGLVASLTTGGTELDPLLEKCFVKNVKIEATTKNMNHGCMGGLFGTAEYMTNAYTNGTKDQDPTNTSNKFYVKDCYVLNVDLKGYTSTGAFYGGNYGFFAYDYRTTPIITNCYVGGNVSLAYNSGTSTSALFNFASLHGAGDPVYTKCYTTTDAYTAEDSDTVADKDTIVSNLATLNSWSADNERMPINNGYPVLAWENTWESTWDGTSVDTTWAGSGTEADPYLITSAAELYGLAKVVSETISTTTTIPVSTSLVDKMYFVYTGTYFKLTTDIDLKNNEWLPIGRYGMRFDGNFDGDGRVVKNLKMTKEYTAMGLFGATGRNARIANIGLDGVDIQFVATNNATDYVANGDPSQTIMNRNRGVGSLIGAAVPGGTEAVPVIENCYAKDIVIKTPMGNNMNNYGTGGLIGQIYYAKYSADTTNSYNKFWAKNCYVCDVDLQGYVTVGAFAGAFCVFDDYRVNPCLINCYAAGDITLTNCATDSGKDTMNQYNFASFRKADGSQCVMENVFTTATAYLESSAGGLHPTYGATATDIAKALVTGNNAWNLDRVNNPVNGGYPVLGWEKWWTTESDPLSSFKSADVTVADGYVTDVTLVQNDSAVAGTVIVAVYDGDRFVSAATAVATNGVIDTEDMAVATGNTVKVFVWDSVEIPSPLALVYSTTVAE